MGLSCSQTPDNIDFLLESDHHTSPQLNSLFFIGSYPHTWIYVQCRKSIWDGLSLGTSEVTIVLTSSLFTVILLFETLSLYFLGVFFSKKLPINLPCPSVCLFRDNQEVTDERTDIYRKLRTDGRTCIGSYGRQRQVLIIYISSCSSSSVSCNT